MTIAELPTPTPSERGFHPRVIDGYIGKRALPYTEEVNLEPEASGPEELFGVREFLAPEFKLPVKRQLDFMSRFWGELGVEHSPDSSNLSAAKLEELRAVIEADPTRRIIPTPVLPGFAEVMLREKGAKAFPKNYKNNFRNPESPLKMPNISSVLGNLLVEPEEEFSTTEFTRTDGNEARKVTYFLGHKSPINPSDVVTHREYIEGLQESGEAVDINGISWVFPAVSVASQDMRGELAKEVYQEVPTNMSEETGAALTLLRLASGSPNQQPVFVNEAVYEKRKGIAAWLSGKAIVRRVVAIRLIPNESLALTAQQADAQVAARSAGKFNDTSVKITGSRLRIAPAHG